jgi:methyl coenzyme M reductase beta subunit
VLLIIFVFDPLAIAMVVAANMAFAQLKKPIKNGAIKEKVIIKEIPVEKIVEKIVEVEKKENPKNYKVYKEKPKPLPPRKPRNTSWGNPGGARR